MVFQFRCCSYRQDLSPIRVQISRSVNFVWEKNSNTAVIFVTIIKVDFEAGL